MNTMEAPRGEKVETLKDIIEDISKIDDEMNAQLKIIVDALVRGDCPTDTNKAPDDPHAIMDTMRRERDKARENLKILIVIRECLW